MPSTYLGPPYSSFRAFFNPSGEGAWSVGRMYPNTGQVVLQMGVNAQQEQPEGISCAAGFRRDIVADATATYSFSASVQAGPITVLPRGAYTIFAEVRVEVFAQGGFSKTARWTFPTSRPYTGANFGVQTVPLMVDLVKGKTYTLAIYNYIKMDYPGVPTPAPYCEIIATYRGAMMVWPDAMTEAPEIEDQESLQRMLARGKVIEREYSDEEMARGGPVDLT